MGINSVLLLLGVAGAAFAQEGCPAESREEASLRAVDEGLNAFSINLYQALLQGGAQGNVVVSPLSAFVVLALVWFGGVGRTAQQLGDALHLPLSHSRVSSGFRSLLGALSAAGDETEDDTLLRLANRLYLQSGFDLKNSFQDTAVQDFRSHVQELNFTDSKNARNTINDWVKNYTNGKIEDLIPPDFLSADTRLVLVNAVYFSAQWRNQFEESNTRSEPFYVSETEPVDVPMMHGSFQLSFAQVPELNATAVRIPYRGRDVSELLLFLPNDRAGLTYLESKLGELYVSLIQFITREVRLTLPKFLIRTTLQLKETLQQMGVIEIFGPQANLSGISDSGLYVNDVVQKAYIDVNENGTEAAAATAVGVSRLTSVIEPVDPIDFIVDHPFLFFLSTDNNIIFMGSVKNPKNEN